MVEDWVLKIEDVCMKCNHHYCCEMSHPPISDNRHDLLIINGVSPDQFEYKGYRRLKIDKNNKCVLFANGKCRIHNIKPETCCAGPFTFDVKDDMIEIFLKYESICPIVRVLKNIPEAYNKQYTRTIEHVSNLVNDLTENELKAVCMIEEPLTEKVGEIHRRQK